MQTMPFVQHATLLPKPRTPVAFPCSRKPTLCSAPAKPRRVAIAGAGIAGLATALTLLRTPATQVQHVHIFEPHSHFDSGQGAALNLNGAAAILANEYGLPIQSIGCPVDTVIAREVSGSTLFHVDVEQAVKASAVAARALSIQGHHSFMTVMRDELQSLLAEHIRDHVTFHRGEGNRVNAVHQQGASVHFELKDGTLSDAFDLVIGADGVRSSVRTHVCMQPTPPIYGGIRIQWAVATGSKLPRGQLEQWFGNGAYVVRLAAGSTEKTHEMIACSFRQPKSTRENEEYQQDKSLREQFCERLQKSAMPMSVIDALERSERLIETAVYRQPIPSVWHRGSCCLVGDSAHAMPPYLGQGANQAVQDAHCLALAIAGIGTRHASLSEALQRYERVRRVPVRAILQTSRLASFLEIQEGIVQTRSRNNFFRVLGVAGVPATTLIQASIPRV